MACAESCSKSILAEHLSAPTKLADSKCLGIFLIVRETVAGNTKGLYKNII